MIRRISAVVTLTFASLLVTAGAAMAQTSSYPVAPSPTTMVKGASGTRGGGTAFTGSSQIPFATIMIVALVGAGVAALPVGPRPGPPFARRSARRPARGVPGPPQPEGRPG